MKGKSVAFYLVMAGLALAVIEELTYKSGAGGLLFGTSGYLKSINTMLPAWHIPGTTSVSVRYPQGIPVRLDAWFVIAGASVWGIQKAL